MTHPDRRRQIDEICDAALDRAATDRQSFVASACGSDESLRRDVEAMLAHAETAERFLTPSMIGELAASSLAADSHSMVNRIISHYRVVERLGAGGMGIVYRAEDTRLQRSVALKFLAPELTRDQDAKRRFVREAQSASALEHSNICTIYEIDEAPDGQIFLAMAYYAGETLKAKIERGPLKIDEVQSYAIQIAEGLAAAHAAGIVHRDIKPANLLVTRDGVVKIVDFGIAKLRGQVTLTRPGSTFGTLAYMSPEQVAGSFADARSDLWSLGVVFYEMVTGRLPFRNEQAEVLAVSIKQDTPEPLSSVQDGVPIAIERIVNRLLAKRSEDRFQTATELLAELKRQVHRSDGVHAGFSAIVKVALALGAIILIAGSVAFGVIWRRSAQERWALEASRDVERLVDAGDYVKAATLTQQALAVRPEDQSLNRLWMQTTGEMSIQTDPPGANVSVQPYSGDPPTWQTIGTTPLVKVRVPKAPYLWRIAKSGFVPIYALAEPAPRIAPGYHTSINVTMKLRPDGSVPADMVVVFSGRVGLGHPLLSAPDVTVAGFLIDRHEVTNEAYKAFVDAGGYEKREFWKQPFVKDGRTLDWPEAIALFRDSTGRAGPATWEAGSFPKGKGQHPVAGVSWYEAAAYAEFVGKTLPTAYHWTRASQPGQFQALVTSTGNFKGEGTTEVADHRALSGFGTTDMAGNVKEWCLNEGRAGLRLILGGGFGEPTYMFDHPDEQSPWDRRSNYGFRCARLDAPATPAAAAKIDPATRDFGKEVPASNEVFNAYRGLYAYDKGELNARVEEKATAESWTRERVSFDAAYGHERVAAYLFLPRNAQPPLQVVVFFPGAYAMVDDKLDLADIEDGMDYFMKSGRALMVPIYKGFYERRDGLVPGGKPPAFFRDHVIAWSKDLGRSLDYLETRGDVDSTRMAFLGMSLGGTEAPLLLAIEKRFKTAIVFAGGFQPRKDLPEVDPFNFAPRTTLPVLMLSGRYDQQLPLESSKLPFFRLLGTPNEDKKHVIYEAGHGDGDLPRREKVRETLDWLDHYLGPVRR